MKKNSFLFELLKTVISSIIIVLVIYLFIGIPVTIKGSSMYPELKNDEFGFGGKFTLWFGIDRYDVVVIDSDKTDDKIVKRVIGLPGETLTFEGDKIYVDGEMLDDPYAYYEHYNDLDYDGKVVELGEDEYFVLGDNRNVSKDSRAYDDPAFTKDEIIAKDILVLFPFSELGIK